MPSFTATAASISNLKAITIALITSLIAADQLKAPELVPANISVNVIATA